MIKKQERDKELDKIQDKEKRIIVANVIDKINRAYIQGSIEYTDFLDMYEQSIILNILNKYKVDYIKYESNEYMERKVFAIYYKNKTKNVIEITKTLETRVATETIQKKIYNTFLNVITCIKITPDVSANLSHKDFMGSIYSLGIKRECIGDIYLYKGNGYVFLIKKVEEYVLNNLEKVGKYKIKKEIVDIFNKDIEKIAVSFTEKNIIVPSLRIDAVISTLFNESRNEVKKKISKGDLVINSKPIFSSGYNIKTKDIISFKRYGKCIIKEEVRKTKNENIVLSIMIYS